MILGYYKYTNFFLSQIATLTGINFYIKQIILPLGISFFTFTQLAFLVDAYQKKAKEYNLLHYILFVTYFPHLIAGPILHHTEMMPQFLTPKTYKFSAENLTIGFLIFIVGLGKKVFIADHLAPYADSIFTASSTNNHIPFVEAWIGAIAYTFQLYFDFSGYSDMAIGLSKMLNIKLPINFNSPYKAQNIVDFWRRWHITLSRFLRDYLYIPLGGNRHGSFQRHRNLITTMVLGGLWHGASWCFVLWGTLHGMYLAINHLWRNLLIRYGLANITARQIYKLSSWMLTFFMVVIAWVFFRAESIHSALSLLHSMFGGNGFSISNSSYENLKNITLLTPITRQFHIESISLFSNSYFFIYIIFGAIICFVFPNTQQIFARYPTGSRNLPWRYHTKELVK